MKQLLFFILGVSSTFLSYAQTGPNSPSAAASTIGIGTNAWTTPNNIFSTDNAYSSVNTNGLTNYLVGTNFGFAIPGPVNIDGIQVDIEKSTLNPLDIAVLNTWTSGTTKTVSAGGNRILIVIYGQENGLGTRDLTGLTYGGQAITYNREENPIINIEYLENGTYFLMIKTDNQSSIVKVLKTSGYK